MIQQGRNQRPLGVEARSYISKHGLTALYRGFVSDAAQTSFCLHSLVHDSNYVNINESMIALCCLFSMVCVITARHTKIANRFIKQAARVV